MSESCSSAGELLIDADEAVRLIIAHTHRGPTETVPLSDALFRTLAEPIVCDVDDPPFDRSVMDGYAVRSADVADVPVVLKLAGTIPAGQVPDQALQPGQAMQINTGAPIPAGADAVVRVEQTKAADIENVRILSAVEAGMLITNRASYIRAGQTVLEAGKRLTPEAIAIAATAGATQVTIYRQPRVAIIVTGDELCDIDQTPSGAQIRNSNQYLLEALVKQAHAEPVLLGIARDDLMAIAKKVTQGMKCDVMCLCGGVSMGKFDFVPQALSECGAVTHFHRVAIKPGRPTLFATCENGQPVFALPGNPISTFIAFRLFVLVGLDCVEGRDPQPPQKMRARLCGQLNATANRRCYQPAHIRLTANGEMQAQPLPWHGSGNMFGLATTDGFIVRPAYSESVVDGDFVDILIT